MQDAKEEVRARLNIEDVIGEYVQLKRAGRNFKGLSPFSGEKTPSFVVSPDKHIWHDFSSNKGGDIFSFIMEVEGMDFRQALEHLARKAGVDMTIYESKNSQDLARRKKRLQQANDLAAHYYQHSLLKNQHAVDYVFKQRGLSKTIVQDFMIGYAPTGGNALVQFLTKKGFTQSELADAGLTNRFGGDLFRGRMTVPLMDGSGQVIGFTARVIGGDDPNAPKYLNTPQTLLYDKSRHVFGLSQAKEAIRTSDYAVIVEGNLDVVSSHQAGVSQVVATAGTAMTESHLKALKRFTGNVRLAFDADKAGISATERAIPIANQVGLELTIITLPEGAKDPDELIQQDVALWQKAIDTSKPAVDWILTQYANREDLNTGNGKLRFLESAFGIVDKLDKTTHAHYLKKIAKQIDGNYSLVVEAFEKRGVVTDYQELRSPTVPLDTGSYYDDNSFQDGLLSVAMLEPSAHELFKTVDITMFDGEDRQMLAGYIQRHPGARFDTVPDDLQKYDTYVKIVLLKAENRYAAWSEQDRYFETARLLRKVENEHKKQIQEQLMHQLREAETIGDDAKATELRIQLNTLIKEITRGQR
ncbi:MAG TPA: DNA primase [Candidatus Saccharimonadales bacterium]